MIIKNMFSKPIDRDIKGVIKVGQDDDANIKQELEEYVVTRELLKHFSDFFASYKRGITGNTDKMGVWISGFFGSGKSHFLKILSYLLENKEVGGKKAIDYFVDDNKISDQMVLADMKLAGTIPTDVVLFNIDSKSEVNGKQSKVAIVSVLQNVFNEMQGFSGSNPFLADLERKLTEEEKYDLFKEKFEDSFGSAWEESRSDFDFIQDDVVEVLDEIGFMSVEAGRNWCEKATGEYTYKVEDFARLVKKYLDKKESNHHIVFLIDEIGQYIGDDSKLMLNLQTVTEDLGTACGGKGVISRALDNEYLNPNHEKECFDVNVLKTLFMIKYVKEIKANIENITSLMVSNVNDDRMALAQQVEDALKRLVRQTLVQKNGDIYVYSGDLFSVFIYRNFDYCKVDGYSAFMTPFVWLFIKTYEALRTYIIDTKAITTLVQMEYSAFEEATVPICSFVLKNGRATENALCFRLSDFKGGMEVQKQKVLEAIDDKNSGYFFESKQRNFSRIPGNPIAYWVSQQFIDVFDKGIKLGEFSKPRQGMATTNNDKFLRLWYEVRNSNIGFGLENLEETVGNKKWFPYNKGGEYRKWYGNNEYVVNFKNKGKEVCDYIDATSSVNSKGRVINREHYFHESITWTMISSSKFGVRYSPQGSIFDIRGSSIFLKGEKIFYLLGLLASSVVWEILKFLSPTISFEVGVVAQIPIIINENQFPNIISDVKSNIQISRADWDSFETSWDFKKHPLICCEEDKVSVAFEMWSKECDERFNLLKANEEELNRIFIDIYGLQDELTPEVEDKDVTVRKADLQRDIKSLKDRVVVIISDALRYEVAHTLFEKMQADEKCNASIGAVQGVLPSYTPLGMASLLPHKTIEYSPSYDVLVDGKACSSTEQREAILKEYKISSKCVQFDSMKTMKQADLRSIFTGQDVVYIYHNQIDARGDKAASENEVFTACEEAIEEIYTLIKRIASQANTYHFIVTADHGFIYKRDKIQATDKIAGAASKSNSVGQRYSISDEEINVDGVCHTTVGKVLGSVDERIVSFPLASDIFKVAGAGQNYVHGGCSPQEMLVPMIDVKVDKGKKETSLAEIALVSLTSKITNLITTLDFVQIEPVSDVVKETSYRVYFISDSNEKISNENIVIADKKDKDTTKRMFRLRFNFKNKKYDKSQKYYLVAYDDKNDIEVLRHEIIMDIAFADDFGFFG